MFHCYDTSVIITIVVPRNKRDFTANEAALLLLVQVYTEDMWSEQALAAVEDITYLAMSILPHLA